MPKVPLNQQNEQVDNQERLRHARRTCKCGYNAASQRLGTGLLSPKIRKRRSSDGRIIIITWSTLYST
jgi:hypothetical protein